MNKPGSSEHNSFRNTDLPEGKKAETGILEVSQSMVETLYARAFSLMGSGHYGQAADLFYVLCALDGQRVDHWLGLGGCLSSLNLGKLAMAAYDVAVHLAPHSAAPRFHQLGRLMHEQRWGEAHAALAAFDKVARLDEDSALISAAKPLRKALLLRLGNKQA